MRTYEGEHMDDLHPQVHAVRAQERTVPVSAAGQALSPTAQRLLALQRTAGNASVAGMLGAERDEESPVREVLRSSGQPLDVPTRSFMESRLGHDFSDVRLHTGPQATESARALQAQAYTVGNDIVVQGDSYQPETHSGQRMLAHELAHVVQQRSGPVDGTPMTGGISVSHPNDRFEQAAERTADRVLTGTPVPAAAGVQRQTAVGEEEEEEAPTTAQTMSEVPEEEEESAPAG